MSLFFSSFFFFGVCIYFTVDIALTALEFPSELYLTFAFLSFQTYILLLQWMIDPRCLQSQLPFWKCEDLIRSLTCKCIKCVIRVWALGLAAQLCNVNIHIHIWDACFALLPCTLSCWQPEAVHHGNEKLIHVLYLTCSSPWPFLTSDHTMGPCWFKMC